jgi:RES domain-containing protein
MILWRISNHANLEGRGGLFASARWHTQGRQVVYLAETPSGALTEVLVHLELDPDNMPLSYKLLKIEAPEAIPLRKLKPSDLPANWKSNLLVTRNIGDEWLAARATALLRVPSAIVPETFNVLLNPLHADARRIRIAWHRKYPWDQRLFDR